MFRNGRYTDTDSLELAKQAVRQAILEADHRGVAYGGQRYRRPRPPLPRLRIRFRHTTPPLRGEA